MPNPHIPADPARWMAETAARIRVLLTTRSVPAQTARRHAERIAADGWESMRAAGLVTTR